MAGLRTLLEFGSGGDEPTNGTMTVTRILASSPSAVNNGADVVYGQCLTTLHGQVLKPGAAAALALEHLIVTQAEAVDQVHTEEKYLR